MAAHLAQAQQMITDAYNIVTQNEEFICIKDYMCSEEKIHEAFWPLHTKFCNAKSDLRSTLNHFSEAAEKTVQVIYEIRNVIERDKENKKKAKMFAKKANTIKVEEVQAE